MLYNICKCTSLFNFPALRVILEKELRFRQDRSILLLLVRYSNSPNNMMLGKSPKKIVFVFLNSRQRERGVHRRRRRRRKNGCKVGTSKAAQKACRIILNQLKKNYFRFDSPMCIINSAPVFRHLAPGINKTCT